MLIPYAVITNVSLEEYSFYTLIGLVALDVLNYLTLTSYTERDVSFLLLSLYKP